MRTPPRYNERELYAAALDFYNHEAAPLVFEEFASDVSRIITLCKTIKQHKLKNGDFNIRLVLNQLICAYNVFGIGAITLLFSVADVMIYPELKTFLLSVNRLPSSQMIFLVDKTLIDIHDVALNVDLLRQIEEVLR